MRLLAAPFILFLCLPHSLALSPKVVPTETPAYNPATETYYLAVSAPEGITWWDAFDAAQRMRHGRLTGHLVTITSEDENRFVMSFLEETTRDYWIGAYQPSGSDEPAGGWRWVTGEPLHYANWRDLEPSNSDGFENCVHLWMPSGEWNDEDMHERVSGYIVEFGDHATGPAYNTQNGHYYQIVRVAQGINWQVAAQAAEEMVFRNRRGHLATIRSEEENRFIASLPPPASSYWVGGYQVPTINQPCGGWRWITGEPWEYTNWGEGEPNNTGGNEDALEFGYLGEWNDRASGTWNMPAFVVEFPSIRLQPVMNEANGHYYQYVTDGKPVSWFEAHRLASDMVYQGMKGHLATVTTAEENSFLAANFPTANWAWLGGFQMRGSAEPDHGWRWITGELWEYTNWAPGEPNNTISQSGKQEDGLTIYMPEGTWNDLWRSQSEGGKSLGFMVEFSAE